MADTTVNRAIIHELYKAFVLLGADHGLLGTVGSWGDSLPDNDVLDNLKGWNDATLHEITDRIEHYERSSRHPAYIQGEQRRTA